MKDRNETIIIVVLLAVGLSVVAFGVLSSYGAKFGCFGPCGTQPYISTTSCYSNNKTCQLVLTGLTNPDVHSLSVESCAFGQSNTTPGVLSSTPNGPPATSTMQPNESLPVDCAYQGTASAGHQIVGSVTMSSGQVILWSGTWQ
jgi:hypothetical protein